MSQQRDLSIDATKGLLVILMVIYHGINYTVQYHLAFKYLAFLPPSFIFIVGMLLAAIYLRREQRPTRTEILKYLKRGIKLLTIFLVLNTLAAFVKTRNLNEFLQFTQFLTHNSYDVFVTGTKGRLAFEVLMPIAYFIIFSPLLLFLHSINRYLTVALAFASITLAIGSEWNGNRLPNLNLLNAGMLGMIAGLAGFERIKRACKNVLLAALFYTAAFATGSVLGRYAIVQLFEATAALALIYSLSAKLGDNTAAKSLLALLGQYSLIAYISQIAILQALNRFAGRPDLLSPAAIILIVATLLSMTGMIYATAWARNQSKPINALYKALFA